MTTITLRTSGRRLGRNYWRLYGASLVSNVGDGIDAAALPLLAAGLTRDPLLFAGVAVAGRVPWLLFALQAGALADRLDRRRVMAGVNLVRFGLLGLLAAAVITDRASIWLLYGVTFLLGIAEVLFDTSSQAILPAVVTQRDQLERANGLLFGTETVANQFVGPPLGGFLFALLPAAPIVLDAGTFLISATLILSLSGTFAARRADPTAPRTTIRADVREGLRWLWRHRLLRTLAVLLGAMNGTAAMGGAVFALLALDTLGIGEVAFGFLLTAMAVGSLVGSLLASRIVAGIGRGPALWSALVVAVASQLATGLATTAWVVAGAAVVQGFAAVVWNVITVSLRQTIIPDELLGRVNAVYRFLGWGSLPLGALLGGVLADAFGLRAPFLIGAGIMAVALLGGVGVVTSRTIEEARAEAV